MYQKESVTPNLGPKITDIVTKALHHISQLLQANPRTLFILLQDSFCPYQAGRGRRAGRQAGRHAGKSRQRRQAGRQAGGQAGRHRQVGGRPGRQAGGPKLLLLFAILRKLKKLRNPVLCV